MLDASLEGVTLQVTNVERSLEFYRKIPGAVVIAHRTDQFALIQLGKGRLGLLSKHLGGPAHIEVDTTDLDGLYQQLQDVGIAPENPPSTKPWDTARDFLIIDPDGHVIEFGEAHGINPADNVA